MYFIMVVIVGNIIIYEHCSRVHLVFKELRLIHNDFGGMWPIEEDESVFIDDFFDPICINGYTISETFKELIVGHLEEKEVHL